MEIIGDEEREERWQSVGDDDTGMNLLSYEEGVHQLG